MNIVDGILLGVLAISVIYGLYHGFIQSVASLLGLGVSVLGGFLFGPQLTQMLNGNQQIREILVNYSDAVVRVGDYELARAPVTQVSGNLLDTVLNSVEFPEAIENLLRNNIITQAFQRNGMATVNDYVSGTLIQSVLSVLSFLVCCLLTYLLWTLITSVIRHVFEFPILRQLDWLAGGLFGLARGAVICYLLVLLIPLVQIVMPDERVLAFLRESQVADIFRNDGFLMRVIRGS
ncbi:MAG: CvpA family protein [Clostridiales bacterium]|nr:CvpA family protein [Clostridiales bacterium]